MDNPLTPSKIDRLINLAQGGTLGQYFGRDILSKINDKQLLESLTSIVTQDTNGSSSGILDLEHLDAFGDSCAGISINKSATFNPGEMTGRSTEAESMSIQMTPDANRAQNPLSWTNSTVNDIVDKLNKQSSDITEIMRNSIASGYSFHSHRDLTADEASLVVREAPLPVPQSELNQNLTRNMDLKDLSSLSSLSVGAYFQNRCDEFGTILPRTDSPSYEYSMGPNLLEGEVSLSQNVTTPVKQPVPMSKLDATLDCVPVRQPRAVNPQQTAQVTPSPRNPPIAVPASPRNPPIAVPPSPRNPPIAAPLSPRNPPIASEPTMPAIPPLPVTAGKAAVKTNPLFADPTKQHLFLQTVTEESSQEETSFSISAIATYLGNESEFRPSDFITQYKSDKKQCNKKEPLTEVQTNIIDNLPNRADDYVVNLKDTERADTACSTATANTVISVKSRENRENMYAVPEVVISRDSNTRSDFERHSLKSTNTRSTDSKTPTNKSNKSNSTCSTVQENLLAASFKSNSPRHGRQSQGDRNVSEITSPNVRYTELDKSVDWQDILSQKKIREGLAKVSICEDWADITVDALKGFVGVSTDAVVTVTTRTDSWLTAQLEFDRSCFNDKDIIIELPRFPKLLSPKKPEQFTIRVTPNVPMKTMLKFTVQLKDASIDMEVDQDSSIDVDFKIPILQVITSDGFNNGVHFAPSIEGNVSKKAIILISDCPADLLLDLVIIEGNSMFSLSHVQEIKRSEVKSSLSDNFPNLDDRNASSRYKLSKPTLKQSCRLSAGNAIRAFVTFNAPKLAELKMNEKQANCIGALSMYIIGTSTIIRKIDLIGTVGNVELDLKLKANKLHVSSDHTILKLGNKGTMPGIWLIKLKENQGNFFKVNTGKVEIPPGTAVNVLIKYSGPEDEYIESTLIIEEALTKKETCLTVTGGKHIQKPFPIKTTYSEMCWVREGRKEINLKNCSDRKINIKCKIVGNGFIMETLKANGTDLLLTFSPAECRTITIIFEPTSMLPHRARLMLLVDNEMEHVKNVRLHGCASGGVPRWSGLLTYGDTALVRALARQPVTLSLYNRARTPAFISATLQFNLQYMSVAATSRLEGARAVIPGRGTARLLLHVEWALVERMTRDAGTSAAATLATITVLTGAEYTRRRILRILKDESNGKLNLSTMPAHLKRLVGHFDGEDASMDESLQEFQETKKSLDVLMGGLQELSAQIDLPQDFADHTIFITDDTVLEHHTLCD